MVRKLMKYDFLSYLRSLIPMDIVLLAIAVITRLIQLTEDNSTSYRILLISSVTALVIACIVAAVMTVVLCVARFYRSMFAAEGYLSLTLPVTHSQHILAKTLSSVIVSAVTALSILIALAIATAGEVFAEIVKAGAYLVRIGAERLGSGRVTLWGIEGLILVITASAAVYLMFYFALTVGQTAKKNRILAAVGVLFGLYLLAQILGTVGIVISVANPEIPERILAWLRGMKENSVTFVAAALIVIYVIVGTVYGLLVRVIMRKKLNVE